MQFKLPSAFLIFLGSYLPLAIILGVQDIPKEWWEQPLCLTIELGNCVFNPFKNGIQTLSFIGITLVATILSQLSLQKISFPYTIDVISAKSIPNDIINYVFPYVVSFMGISYSEPEKLLGFAVFLLWMFAITYKSGQIIMNPLLLMFGWKLYEANIVINNQSRDVRILKMGKITPGQQKAQTIQDFYLTKD